MLSLRSVVTAIALIAACGLLASAAEVHKGKVLAVSDKSITIRDDRDMDDDMIRVTNETKITRNGKAAKLADIGIGDVAKIEATEVDGKLTAKSIDAFMPE